MHMATVPHHESNWIPVHPACLYDKDRTTVHVPLLSLLMIRETTRSITHIINKRIRQDWITNALKSIWNNGVKTNWLVPLLIHALERLRIYLWSTALRDTNSRSVQGRRDNGIIGRNWIYLQELKLRSERLKEER